MNSSVTLAKQQRRHAERHWRKSDSDLTVHKQIFQAKNYEVKDTITTAKSSINECTSSNALYNITNELCGKRSDPILPKKTFLKKIFQMQSIHSSMERSIA